MEFMDIVAGIVMGIGIGCVMLGLYIWILYQRIRGRVDDMVNQIVQEAHDNLVGLEIELDKGVYFCYNSENKQFVCQGTTVADIRQVFQDRFPGKTAYLAGGDPAVVAQFCTELIELRSNENSSSQ
jgi:MFS superfamily sulfate permease-like transporter